MKYIEAVKISDVVEVFGKNIKNLKVNGTIEKNTFTLIYDYFDGKYDDELSDIEKLTSELLTNMIEGKDIYKVNINEISACLEKYKRQVSVNQYEELKAKLNSLKIMYFDVDAYGKLYDKEPNKYNLNSLNEAQNTLRYSIIELKAALGLPMTTIDNSYVRKYCESIVCDVNNNKYKRLSIADHIMSDGNINPYK